MSHDRPLGGRLPLGLLLEKSVKESVWRPRQVILFEQPPQGFHGIKIPPLDLLGELGYGDTQRSPGLSPVPQAYQHRGHAVHVLVQVVVLDVLYIWYTGQLC